MNNNIDNINDEKTQKIKELERENKELKRMLKECHVKIAELEKKRNVIDARTHFDN